MSALPPHRPIRFSLKVAGISLAGVVAIAAPLWPIVESYYSLPSKVIAIESKVSLNISKIEATRDRVEASKEILIRMDERAESIKRDISDVKEDIRSLRNEIRRAVLPASASAALSYGMATRPINQNKPTPQDEYQQ